MRYLTTLTLASISATTGIAFLLEWHDIFTVLAVITVILIGLPVLSLASNFWFGEMPPQVHVYDRNEDYDRRSSLMARSARPQAMTNPGEDLTHLEVSAIRDGFPHSAAVVLGLAFACALSFFVVAAWGGLLH
jgi:cytochrome c biogenesis protein CcdA